MSGIDNDGYTKEQLDVYSPHQIPYDKLPKPKWYIVYLVIITLLLLSASIYFIVLASKNDVPNNKMIYTASAVLYSLFTLIHVFIYVIKK